MIESLLGYKEKESYFWLSNFVGEEKENSKSFQLNHSFRQGYVLYARDEKGDYSSTPLFKIVGNRIKRNGIFPKNYRYLKKLNKVLNGLAKENKEKDRTKTCDTAKKALDEAVRVVVAKNIDL